MIIMDNPYLRLYLFYNSRVILFIRIALLIGLCAMLILTGLDQSVAKYLFLIYFILLLHELFILDRVHHTKPQSSVNEGRDVWDAVVFGLVYTLKNSVNVQAAVAKIAKNRQVLFFQEKIGASYQVTQVDTTDEDVLKKAHELVKKIKGTFVYPVDFFAAFLIVTEEKTGYLQQLELKEQDVVNILLWTRNAYGIDEPKKQLQFLGFGVFDSLVYGWNVEIRKYALNFTYAVLSKAFPPTVVGRSNEYEEFLVILSKDSSNNVLLVGEAGSGKTSLVEYFAYNSHIGNTPDGLGHKVVYELLVDQFLAGASSKGEQQARFTALIQDIQHSGNVLLFIQNIETIFGGGGVGLDISGVLFEYLKAGTVQVIGTTTLASFNTYLKGKQSVANLFEDVRLDEPDKPTALFMLFEKVPLLEQKFHVKISYPAVKTSVDLSASYFPDRILPGKAITMLEDTASRARMEKRKFIEKDDVIRQIETKTDIVLEKPTQKEKNVLLHLEDEIHKRIINQEDAVHAIASAMRRLRSGFSKETRPISTFLFLGPTGVGKTETAKALAQIYFHDKVHMIRIDMSEYQAQESLPRLLGAFPAEAYIPNTLTEQVKDNPFSLVLLDEFEKAHPHILDLFLQVFDDGRLTDNSGKTISFANTIIIATSNAGSEMVREGIERGTNKNLKGELTEYLLKNNLFKPELINRFDEVVVFTPLSHEHIKEIIKLLFKDVSDQLAKQEITLQVDNAVIEKIIQEGYSAEFGARNVRRYIEENIEEVISKAILENKLGNGSTAHLTIDGQGNLVVI